MSKIQREPSPPTKPPEPQKTARPSGAPPFTPSPLKPRQSAAPQSAGAAQSQRPQVKTGRQARATMQSAPNERPVETLQERTRESATSDLTSAPNASTRFDSGPGMLPVAFFDDFGDKQDGFTESSAGATLEPLMEAAALDESLDATALARLLPPGDNNGIFDVILPTGDQLGVVVSGQSSSLSYLLSPSTDKFASRLRRNKMELEERLEQLTHRNVNITVL
jgi:hypothetical protein